ncbi:MAG: TraR/DksA family transcriptional regulator [Gammaproteobacteria bacterium]
MLTESQLAKLQSRLETLRDKLQQQLQLSAAATGVVELDQTLVGRVSRVDALQQQSMALSTMRKIEHRLARVQQALARAADGDYGYCQRCDEAIELARLEAQPESALCLQCQDQFDRS